MISNSNKRDLYIGTYSSSGAVEGRADGADLDVGEDDVGVGGLGLDIGGNARVSAASTASGAGAGLVGRVGGVEPEHVGVVVIPDGHDENHTLGESLAHLRKTALLSKNVLIAESLLLGGTVVCGDGVALDAGDVRLGVGKDLAVLDVEALDIGKGAAGLDELRDDGDLLGGVDGELGALAVEGGVALAVAVEVASIGVALAGVPGGAVGASAGVAVAAQLADRLTGVRGVGGGDGVGLPDVHLGAARAHVSDAGVGIVGRRHPTLDVGLAVNELEVAGTLAVAVAGSVGGTGLVGRELGHAAISIHGDEVQGAVQTAL